MSIREETVVTSPKRLGIILRNSVTFLPFLLLLQETGAGAGAISGSVSPHLVSHAPPIFSGAPHNVTLIVGDTLYLRVKVLSSAEYLLKWIKEDPLNPPNSVTIQSRIYSHDVVAEQLHYLILENVTYKDAGWYKCVAMNSIGGQEKRIYVDVLEGKKKVEGFKNSDGMVTPLTNCPNYLHHVAYIMIPTVLTFLVILAVVCYLFWRVEKLLLSHHRDTPTRGIDRRPYHL